jgi:SOS-response transcriptional repressor LexA
MWVQRQLPRGALLYALSNIQKKVLAFLMKRADENGRVQISIKDASKALGYRTKDNFWRSAKALEAQGVIRIIRENYGLRGKPMIYEIVEIMSGGTPTKEHPRP